jgi:hypothetical protein
LHDGNPGCSGQPLAALDFRPLVNEQVGVTILHQLMVSRQTKMEGFFPPPSSHPQPIKTPYKSNVEAGPAHLFGRRSTVKTILESKGGFPLHPCAQPCGTTRTLLNWTPSHIPHHVPTPLRSTVVTRFFATTRALTPTDPFATGRGSLIHVIWTSDHSVSNHLRFSVSRYPLPPR